MRYRYVPLILLAAGVIALFAQQPYTPYVPLGTLHCAEDRNPLWVHVWARLGGRTTEVGIDTWLCPETYEEMAR